MGKGIRQTFYFKDLEAMKNLAEDENMEVNGSTFEDLFWEKYAGSDANYKAIARELYSNDSKIGKCYQDVLQMMGYRDEYLDRNNLDFIKIIRESLNGAAWDNNEDTNFTDYRIENREFHIDNLSGIFKTIVTQLEFRKKFVNESKLLSEELTPWDMTVQDERYKDILMTEANYSDKAIENFKYIAQSFEEGLKQAITPKEVVDIIITNWEYLWNFASTYEAVEYCVVLANKLIDKPIIKRKIREFFKAKDNKIGVVNVSVEALVKQPKLTANSLERIATYLAALQGNFEK